MLEKEVMNRAVDSQYNVKCNSRSEIESETYDSAIRVLISSSLNAAISTSL